jgi:hypothetical protein
MLVFIDDSGDPSFSIEEGSSKAFVIACVIFDDTLEAEKTSVALKELRRSLGFPDSMEFKFNKSSKKIREAFLQATIPFSYRIRSIVMRKEVIRSQELRSSQESFYSFTIKEVLKHSRDSIHNARIRLDGHGNRIFRQKMQNYLRREVNASHKIIEHFKFVDSSTNMLIQMADMIAGTMRRKAESEKTDANFYFDILNKSDKIEDYWEFK